MHPLTPSRVEAAYLLDQEIYKRVKNKDIDELIEDLKGILSNSWQKAVREALLQSINVLESLPGPVTKEELSLIERKVARALGMSIDEAKRQQLITIQRSVYAQGAEAVGVKIAWNLADLKALEVLDENLMFWIGSYYGDNLQEGFNAVLQDYFTGGYNRRDLAELMKQHFQALGDKGDAYWDLLADHTATKTREIGRVSGYEQAGVEKVRVKARIDEKTSEICRRLHGTVMAVKDLRGQVDRYFEACETKNKERIKAAWPWWTDGAAGNLSTQGAIDRNVRRGKIGLPPYHGRCRTITVVEFVSR